MVTLLSDSKKESIRIKNDWWSITMNADAKTLNNIEDYQAEQFIKKWKYNNQVEAYSKNIEVV